MKNVQKENLSVVNEALNEIYVSEEDFAALRQSIDEFDNFDQILLAQKIEKHELLEFRRISAYIFKKNKRYSQSMALSKGDNMFKDAIDTAAESGDADLVEDLLRFFVNTNDKAGFSACLFTCYDLVRPDVAVELAWRNGYTDHAMPYVIQYLRHLHDKINTIETRTAPPPEPEAEENDGSAGAGLIMGGLIMGQDTLMIGNGGPQQQQFGGYPQQQQGGIPDPYQQQQQQQFYQQQGFPQQGFQGQGF
jgi:clathrin heavy chain